MREKEFSYMAQQENSLFIVKDSRLFIELNGLDNLQEIIIGFFGNKKLKYIQITNKGNLICSYDKERFLLALQYIKQNQSDFVVKSDLIHRKKYQYTGEDLLVNNYTFHPDELVLWDQLVTLINIFPLENFSQNKSFLGKLKLLKLRNEKNIKNVLAFTPLGFAALAVILGHIKQIDDKEGLTESIFREETSAGTFYYYSLYHKDLPNGMNVLHLSDLHLGENTYGNIIKLETFANQMNPVDFTFITGDIFDLGLTSKNRVGPILKKILQNSKAGFFVLGNHDYRSNGQASNIANFMDSIGYKNTTNTYYELFINGQKIGIAGMDDYLMGEKSPSKISIDTSDHIFNVMLTHNLDGYHPLQDNHKFVDLVLSGHFHSGEIELGIINGTKMFGLYPGTNQQLVGWKKLSGTNTLSYISPGFSTINPLKKRIFSNPAGYTLIEFKKIGH